MTPIQHSAAGIHSHPTRKLGRRPPSNKPALFLSDILSGVAPAHPAISDHIAKNQFGLYGNDTYGDCGPTSVANLVRLVTVGLLGSEQQPTQNDVFDLYRRSGNPNFDPADPGGPGDGGVDMQTMLEALLAGGIGGIKPLCFAKVDVSSDAELDAAVAIFGGTLWGVNLEVSQQTQTDNGEWDYAPSSDWGGHAIVNGAYDEDTKLEDVVTWAERVKTTATFRRHQLEEAWVVIWQWNIDHPAFQEGIDVQALANAYHALTGKTIPDLPAPQPAPAPAPTPPGGGGNTGPFLVGPFSDHVASRLAAKAQQRGMTIEQYITYHVQFGSSHWKG
jgi:hypothetical protein